MASTNRLEEYTDTEGKDSDGAQKDDLLLLARKLRGYTDNKFKALEKTYEESLKLAKNMTEQVKLLREEIATYNKQMQDISFQQVRLQGEQKSLKDYWELHAATLRKDLFDKASSQFASQDEWLTKRLEATSPTGEMEALSKSFNAGAESTAKMLEGLFKLLPVPQVTTVLPEAAIKIFQATPNVHVSPEVQLIISDKALNIPPAIVNIPKDAIRVETAPALVHVQVPEQHPPDVHLEVKNKPMMKTFEYFENGQPKHIYEKYMDEED
jgi:hypothetical protein